MGDRLGCEVQSSAERGAALHGGSMKPGSATLTGCVTFSQSPSFSVS